MIWFLSLFFIWILSLGNYILLILGFIDNILDRHNYWFIIFIQKICIYLFLKSKNLLKFLQFGEATWRNYGV